MSDQDAFKLDIPANRYMRIDGWGNDTRSLLTAAGESDVRQWYANGLDLPTDRPGLIGLLHPQIHKSEGVWEAVIAAAIETAKRLNKWVWVTQGECRWVYVILGDAPVDEDSTGTNSALHDIHGEWQNDQYITCFDPQGAEHFFGSS